MALFEDSILEIGFLPGTMLTRAAMEDMVDHFKERANKVRAHFIIDLSGIDNLEVDVAARVDRIIRNSRVALLGSGPADKVLARFLMRKLDPERTCEYFERRANAVEYVLRSV